MRRPAFGRSFLWGGLVGARFEAGNAAGDGEGGEVDDGDERRGEEAPGDGGVEGGGAEFVEEEGGLVPEQLAHAGEVEGEMRGGEEVFAGADAGEHDGDVDGPAGLVEELDDGLVEFQGDGGDGAEEGGEAEDGEEGAGHADGEGEGDFFGGDALGELGDDGVAEAALPEAALVGGGVRRRRR